jgi:hypothetical protein
VVIGVVGLSCGLAYYVNKWKALELVLFY